MIRNFNDFNILEGLYGKFEDFDRSKKWYKDVNKFNPTVKIEFSDREKSQISLLFENHGWRNLLRGYNKELNFEKAGVTSKITIDRYNYLYVKFSARNDTDDTYYIQDYICDINDGMKVLSDLISDFEFAKSLLTERDYFLIKKIKLSSKIIKKISSVVKKYGWEETNPQDETFLTYGRGGTGSISIGMDDDEYFYVYCRGKYYKCDGLEELDRLVCFLVF